ncbi:MAG: zinc-ribbon domain-containing protein [Thermoplasmatales archaeon]|nr:zinc-ribbon domain-containing protein [Thermoplasmatales archaeon]
MFCQKCGKENEDGARFCAHCGAEQAPAAGYQNLGHGGAPLGPAEQAPAAGYQRPPVYYTEKSVGLTIILGLIITGAGQMYVGKIGRGIAFLLCGMVLAALTFAFIPVVILLLIFLIYVLYDAYSLAKEYNTYLRMNGQPPW